MDEQQKTEVNREQQGKESTSSTGIPDDPTGQQEKTGQTDKNASDGRPGEDFRDSPTKGQ